MTTRKSILDDAAQCVCQDRETQYGAPEDNFARIAELWNAYKPCGFTAHDVGMMLALLKIGRIASGQTKADNYIDLAGYAACAGEIALKGKEEREMREKRLIDGDALIPAITDLYEPIDPSQPMTFNLAQIKEVVDAMPTVEPKRGEWVSVTERMPKHGYVYWVADGYTIKTAYLDGAMDWVDSGNQILKHVTHWMLLHESPDDMRTGEK